MKNTEKPTVRYVRADDREFWFGHDKHLPAEQFDKKVNEKQGYVLSINGKRIALLRYNLFWDNTPFLTLLYVDRNHRRRGYGRLLLEFWENDMRALGYTRLLTSTQSDETAQHFYRALGYADCGVLLAPDQASELFFSKDI